MNMKSSDIGRLRLQSQQLLKTRLKTARDMVSWFGAFQDQEYIQTKWGLGLRLPNLTDADIEKDLSDGILLRTHLLRPTWHLVTTEDIRWLLKLTAPRINAANAFTYRKYGLDDKVFNKCNDVLTGLLQGNKQLTRAEIGDELEKNKIKVQGLRIIYILMRSELDGIVCSGARRGNEFTYALLEERAAKGRELSGDEALAELAKRYFISRGPATEIDFSTWSGLTLKDCRRGLESSKACFDSTISGGKEYYFSPRLNPGKKPSTRIYLLPSNDEFIMGYKDRDGVLELKRGLKTDPAFRYDCMIVGDGQIIGTWKRTIGKNQIDLEYDLFLPLDRNQNKEFDNIIKRFSSFHQKTVNYGRHKATSR